MTKTKRNIIIILGVIIFIGLLAGLGYQFKCSPHGINHNLAATTDCDHRCNGTKAILPKKPVYEVGLNKYGRVVFKNPKAAWKDFTTNYRSAITATKKANGLGLFNRCNLAGYKNLGWQDGTKDGRLVSTFSDVYGKSLEVEGVFY